VEIEIGASAMLRTDVVGQGDGIPRGFQAAGIELPGRQVALVDVQKVAGLRRFRRRRRIHRVGLAGEETVIPGLVRGPQVDPGGLVQIRLLIKHEMFAVRQKLRPEVGTFRLGFVQLEHQLRLSAARRHTVKAAGEAGREQNLAVPVPRAAARGGFRRADDLGSAARDLYLL